MWEILGRGGVGFGAGVPGGDFGWRRCWVWGWGFGFQEGLVRLLLTCLGFRVSGLGFGFSSGLARLLLTCLGFLIVGGLYS